MRILRFFALPLAGLAAVSTAAGQSAVVLGPPPRMHWITREFLVQAPGSPGGLDVLKVEVERPGRHPLALLTHGTSNNPVERSQMTPWSMLPQARWFAQRGFVVLVVVRKGYGR